MLYELLTGRPPFTGDSSVAVAYKQVNETPELPSSLNPDVPPSMDAVVMKALSKNPSNRYQSADEFSADLARVIAGQQVEATPLMPALAGGATQVINRPASHTAVLPPAEEPEGSGRKVWLGVLIGLLLFALLAAGGYLLVSSLVGDEPTDGPQTVTVGDYEGDRYARAPRQSIDLLGLGVRRETQETDDPTEVGIVLRQDPAPGTELSTASGDRHPHRRRRRRTRSPFPARGLDRHPGTDGARGERARAGSIRFPSRASSTRAS